MATLSLGCGDNAPLFGDPDSPDANLAGVPDASIVVVPDASIEEIPDASIVVVPDASPADAALPDASPPDAPGPSVTCPEPTQAGGGRVCVLTGDTQIKQTLELGSAMTLDCRGFHLRPFKAGDDEKASIPEVGVAIIGQHETRIENCEIGTTRRRFDVGVLIADSKNAGDLANAVVDNRIHVREAAVAIIRSDDNEVADNEITWTTGIPLVFPRDADRNVLRGNRLVKSTWVAPVRLKFTSGNDGAIATGNYSRVQPLFNFVIGGRLLQYPNSTDGTYGWNDDNVLEGNFIAVPGNANATAILANTLSSGTIIRGNRIEAAGTGIRMAGGMRTERHTRAARCVAPGGAVTARFCASDADCFIAGIDDASLGTCPPVAERIVDSFAGESVGTVVENNVLVGPFTHAELPFRAGIAGGNGTKQGIIRGNRVTCTGVGAAITLQGFMMETGLVTGNVASGCAPALGLGATPTYGIGARVHSNDFVSSVGPGVVGFPGWTLATELSWEGVGNFWGHTSAPCFTAADSSNADLIKDSAAACTPFQP